MWEHIQPKVSDPTAVLNTPNKVTVPTPRTGLKFKNPGRKKNRTVKVPEWVGSTYNKGAGIVFDEAAREQAIAFKKRSEEIRLAEMLAEQTALMAEYDKRR